VKSLASIVVAGLLLGATATGPGALYREMKRLNVRTVLVLPSSAIDDYPVWSPDGRYVAANVMGTWRKVDLAAIELAPGRWHGSAVGVTKSPEFVSTVDPADLEKWKPATEPDSDLADTGMVRIEFRRHELSTSLVVTQRGKAPKVLWTSDLETCGAPVVSPDSQLVAYLCETDGLLVMDVGHGAVEQ
jgi:hypothetical protein